MATNTLNPIRGSTASSAVPAPRSPGAPPGRGRSAADDAALPPPRHRLGDLLRAIGVFADTAFRVVVLGTDGTRQPDPPGGIPRQSHPDR